MRTRANQVKISLASKSALRAAPCAAMPAETAATAERTLALAAFRAVGRMPVGAMRMALLAVPLVATL
jgi:hypothetical protein